MKIYEVIEAIKNYHPQFPEDCDGCDSYKSGDPEIECTGVVCALSPNINVIKKAIGLHANLIVVHEPTYYTSKDSDHWPEDFENRIYEEKRKLLEDHGIVIWRDHDHMHAHEPDAIFTGVLKYLGWEQHARCEKIPGLPYAHYIVDIPKMRVKDLCHYLIDKIGTNGARVVGDLQMEVERIAFVGHLIPDDYTRKDGSKGEYSVKVIETLEKKADVILPGEVIDWTAASYVNDAFQLGHHKALINIGHFNWEELGMRYMEDWLKKLLPETVCVTYVKSDDIYHYVLREETV